MTVINVNLSQFCIDKNKRVLLCYSSWNDYISDVKNHLLKEGYKNVDIKILTKKHFIFFPVLCVYYFFKYDVFFCFDGKTLFFPIPLLLDNKLVNFFRFSDVKFYHLLKKHIFLVFQGSDLRNGIFRKYPYNVQVMNASYFSKLFKSIYFCDGIVISTPDLYLDLPSRAHKKVIWFPKLTKIAFENRKFIKNFPLRILHAYTRIKGTEQIKEAVSSLGGKISLVLLNKCPNKQVLQEGRKCFCAIDQLLTEIYGTFAMEMMALGLPVLGNVAKNIRNLIFDLYKIECPILQINCDSLTEDIRHWLEFLELEENYMKVVEQGHLFLKKVHSL